jgi:hypothetical protein
MLECMLAATGCSPRTVAIPIAPSAAWTDAEWRSRFGDADSLRLATLAPGVRHVYLWMPRGPWAVHVIEIDERVCSPEIEAIKAGPPLEALAPTTTLAESALAAINADFFQAPGGTPVGAHVTAGAVLVGPGTRPIYAIDVSGTQWAGGAVLAGAAFARADTLRITQVNRPIAGARHQPPVAGLTLFNHWFGEVTPPDDGGVTLRVRILEPRIAGDARGAVRSGIVVARNEGGTATALDGEHVAFQGVGADALAWLRRRAPGDTLRWTATVVPARDEPRSVALADHGAVEAVGGFPMLVADGHGVYAEQTGVIDSFGPVRHPRTAVGWNAARGRTLWVVVDGRRASYSDGMSLPELEWLMLRLGAADAVNLDGGGSTTLALAGMLANRPTDASGERAVSNALVLRRCR